MYQMELPHFIYNIFLLYPPLDPIRTSSILPTFSLIAHIRVPLSTVLSTKEGKKQRKRAGWSEMDTDTYSLPETPL